MGRSGAGTTGIGFLHSPSLQRALSNPPALGPGFDAWGYSRETRELAGAVGEGATPCTDGRPSEGQFRVGQVFSKRGITSLRAVGWGPAQL